MVLDLLTAPRPKPGKAKEREEQLRRNADALALFKVQQEGFGSSERGTIRAGTSLSIIRGETFSPSSTQLRTRTGDRPGEATLPQGPQIGPPAAPTETVPVSPLSSVIAPAPASAAVPKKRKKPAIQPLPGDPSPGQVAAFKRQFGVGAGGRLPGLFAGSSRGGR